MLQVDPQHWALFESFNPDDGIVIRRPPDSGVGYWVGAPGAMYDPIGKMFYLLYRIRRPRGVQPDRGAELHLARSGDGIEFETIWTGTKQQLQSTSIERCAIRRLAKDRWVLYVSYVDPADGRWRIDSVQSQRPESFDLAHIEPTLTASQVGTEGVKDPFVFQVGGMFHMVVSCATLGGSASADDLHGTHDAYNTGLIRSATGLAISANGIDWNWEGEIFGPTETGWDKYCARISTIWRQDGIWLALYDGSTDVSENYEERVGLAFSFDLRRFQRVTHQKPLMLSSAGNNKALRYFDSLAFRDELFLYYEMALPDGCHDLRVYRRKLK